MFDTIDEVEELLEKTNANLEPELLSHEAAKELLASYARVRRLADFGIAALARKVSEVSEVAHVTGTPVGKAKETVATGKILGQSEDLNEALKYGDISFDQAVEIAKAEEAAPGVAKELISIAKKEPFHVLRDKSRKAKLEAEQHHGLADRQHAARSGRSYVDDLGMVNINLRLEPYVGTPLVNRAEAEAKRLHKAARKNDIKESFECHLGDAYAKLLSGNGKASTTRPELVVLVSHGVAKRGWTEVRKGEVCKIPGVGPIAPEVARKIAERAFLNAIACDGKDLRNFRRWTRSIPKEVRIALELGKPPDFDGILCVDCGNRIGNQMDHVQPHSALGPASTGNLDPRCWDCHPQKTERDRKAGRLKPPEP